ncbi:MAG: UDP-N-acetylmuramoyl-L-alanyl-D-glutamate--2,6-diaminopimelate ligase [Hyphomicrobiales bacterium]
MLLSDILPKDAEIVGNIDGCEVHGLTADSRAVKPGFVFAALKGVNSDGALFAEQAIKAGAVAILCDKEDARYHVPTLITRNARLGLAEMAAQFYPAQPATIAAVTGTAGKTSVAAFLRQIWLKAGKVAASIGTVGVVSPVETVYGSLTTPDPVQLHETIDRLARAGVTHLALEASSHGLDQYRLDGVQVSIGAFTNLGRDHMDYHETIEDYFNAKMALFNRLLPKGAPIVVDTDSPYGEEALAHGLAAGCSALTTGSKGNSIRLISMTREGFGQRLKLDFGEGAVDVFLPLVGLFQVSNALVAATQAFATDVSAETICSALEELKGEAGRLEYMGTNSAGALVFIDYAHKVEALENVLEALRPYADHHLTVVFGAGGDRDMGKRPLMGTAASKGADRVIVTDDNPRSEDPASIRAAVLAKVPDGMEIGDREKAIFHAIENAVSGDVVVIAGKGHETGQIVGDKVLPFSDHEVVARALSADKG